MSAPNSKILARIEALLAKADATTYEAEAQTYREKAAELMATHAVSEAILDAARTARGEHVDDPVETVSVSVTGDYGKPRATLLAAIAKAMSCYPLVSYASRSDRSPTAVLLYGHRSDLERVQWLYASLLVQVLRQASRVQAAPRPGYLPRPATASQTAAARRAYVYGFAVAIGERMRAATTDAAREAGTGTDLVLVKREQAGKDLARQMHPKTTRARAASVSQIGAYKAGKAAGQRADIGQTAVSAGRRRAITS